MNLHSPLLLQSYQLVKNLIYPEVFGQDAASCRVNAKVHN